MLLNGDCIEEMQKLIDDGVQVDSIVTDPPYHLQSIVDRFGKEGSAPAKFGTDGAFKRASTGFMGKEWDGGDIAFRKETWELAYKLLKPGGHLLAFSASRNYHRMAVAIEDAGFEIRDQIMWIYGSGFPKSLNIGKGVDKKLGNKREVVKTIERGDVQTAIDKGVGYTADPANRNNKAVFGYGTETVTKGHSEWEGWGTALKPAHEPIVMARKPIEGSIVDNVLKHGTGGINIDGCRIAYGEGNEPIPQLAQGKTKVNSTKTMFDGQSLHKSKTEAVIGGSLDGRFPANVMHDGSEEVLSNFPNTKSVKGNPRTAIIKNQTRLNNSKEVFVNNEYDDEGSAARFFYCPKVSKSERNQGLEHFSTVDRTPRGNNQGTRVCVDCGLTDNGTNDHSECSGKFEYKLCNPTKNTHPTVKPIELMKYLCRLVTPKGGTILDPFMGSGSTGMAAKDEGFEFIGIEREKEYFEIAESRITRFAPLMDFM